jgi:hypothetical protein
MRNAYHLSHRVIQNERDVIQRLFGFFSTVMIPVLLLTKGSHRLSYLDGENSESSRKRNI